ncbi:hypothetical protein CVT24_005108 [Panaeolus cyanescens]|uniref:DUF6533 domain-containing protein n=1 Tax=Panaeolus cyanescens TaxID=181874 RepID=A0A409VPV0_9AGAR|nr:hypothetical protein CVT24_005108 [Panaeolus cyanescens]
MDQTFSTSTQFRNRNYSSLTALIVIVLDYLLTLKFEYTCIWKSPYCASNVLYICSRYVGLSFGIAHHTLIHTQLAKAPLTSMICKHWILGLLAAAVLTLLFLDMVLFLRLFALYQQRKRILWVLVPLAAQPIGVAIAAYRTLYKAEDINGICDYRGSIVDTAVSSSATVIFAHGPMAYDVQQTQYRTRTSRCCSTGCSGKCLDVGVDNDPFFSLPWAITLVSMMCCRLIMNMHRLKVEQQPRQGNTIEQFVFSTIIPSNTASDVECPPEAMQATHSKIGLAP